MVAGRPGIVSPMVRNSLLLLALGAVTVLQATLNRRIGSELGLGGAVLLNAVVMCGAAAILVGYLTASGTTLLSNGALLGFEGLRQWSWWWILPGLFGLGIVLGLPMMVERVGALTVFVGLVAGQTIAGLIWDALEEGIAVTPSRALGVACAIAAVLLVGRR